jgi:hypothetical protein
VKRTVLLVADEKGSSGILLFEPWRPPVAYSAADLTCGFCLLSPFLKKDGAAALGCRPEADLSS